MKRFLHVIPCVCFLLYANTLFAYDEKVHPKINENAAFQSQLDFYIKNFGFQEGIEKRFDWDGDPSTNSDNLKPWEWISKGGTDEDGTFDWIVLNLLEGRYLRHFHDPLKPWDQAGLTLTVPDSKSNLLWAQEYDQDYSWHSARDLYYHALITGEEQVYAATFTTLGHLMHLIADMAVPAHVRDDAHPISFLPSGVVPRTWLGDFYEKWAKKTEENSLKTLNYEGLPVQQSVFGRANPETLSDAEKAPVPISALWDQNVYLGNNPVVTRDSDLAQIGLAEFTNANFLSQDTIFNGYAHPGGGGSRIDAIGWLNPVRVVAEDEVEDFRHYIHGDIIIDDIGGQRPIRLAGTSFITLETWLYGNLTEQVYQLDDLVFEDYAQALIPRAVGYSTALLDYFFRGQIEFEVVEDALLSQVSEYPATMYGQLYDSVDNGLTRILVKARNITQNGEQMTGGANASIQLVVKYQINVGTEANPVFETRYSAHPEASGKKTITSAAAGEALFWGFRELSGSNS